MKFSMKRALALLLALLMAVPAFAFAEPLDNDFEIAFEEEVEETVAEDSVDEVAFDLSELSEAEPEAPPADEAEELEVDEEIVEEETEETAEDEAALVVLNPAFVQTVAVEGGSITVKAAEGVFPNDAVLSVTPVQMDVVGEVEGEIKSVYTYDIKVFSADGEELYQPDDDELVEIIFDLPEVADESLTATVFHVLEDEEVEELAVTDDGANAKVVTRSFSFYQVVFYYELNGTEYGTGILPTGTYTLKSGDLKDGILLSDILKGISGRKTLYAVIAGSDSAPLNASLDLELSKDAQKVLEKTEYTTTQGTTASKDFILTPKENYNLVPHDQYADYFMTVEHTTSSGTIHQAVIYLEFASTGKKVGIAPSATYDPDYYYDTLEEAIDAFVPSQSGEKEIRILDDLTTTAAVEMKDKAYVLNLNQKTLTIGGTKVLNVVAANEDTSLTIPATVTGGTLAGDILVSGGASFKVMEGAKVTFDGTVSVADDSIVKIYAGTFNKAVNIATAGSLIDGGTFNAAVTVPDHSISGGYFAIKPTEAQLVEGYTTVPVNNYWHVVNESPVDKKITYRVYAVEEYNADTLEPSFKGIDSLYSTGVTIPDDQYYYDDSTDATVLWDAKTAYAEFGEVDYWYRGTSWKTDVYDKREAGEAPTALTEIPAKSREDVSTLQFVALVSPYLATVNGKGYTTLAEAGKAAVDGNKPVVVLREPVTNSNDYYELARGKTLVVDVSKTGFSMTTEQWAEGLKQSRMVRAGGGDELTYTVNDNSHEITFAVAPYVASVKTSAGVVTYYSKFEKEGEDAKKEYALNQALAATGNTLSVSAPIEGNEATIARAIPVGNGTPGWETAILGFENITFETNGSLTVGPNATLTIDSENYSKVKGTDDTSFLVVVDPETEDENKFQWNTASAKWVPYAEPTDKAATLYASNGTTEKGTFETLKKAVAAASANDVIKLNKDTTDELVVNKAKGEDGIVLVNKNLTIDTNGFTITSNALNTIVVDGGATLTVIGNVSYMVGDYYVQPEAVANSNEKTDARTILVKNGTLNLKDAWVTKPVHTSTITSPYAIKVASGAELAIEEKTFAQDGNNTFVMGLLDIASGATVTLTDGFYTDTANVPGKLAKEYYQESVRTYPNDDPAEYFAVNAAEAYIATTTGGVGYKTLKGAFDAAMAMSTAGQEIHVVKDVTNTAYINDVTKDATLEMDGHKVAANITVYNEATLTVNGTDATASAPASVFKGTFIVGAPNDPSPTYKRPGTLVVSHGTFNDDGNGMNVTAYAGSVTINDAIFNNESSAPMIYIAATKPDVEVTLGGNNKFTSVGEAVLDATFNGLKKLTVTDGSYTAKNVDYEFNVSDDFADAVNAYGDKSGVDVGGITGGKFAHNEFSKGGVPTNLDELCPYGYAVTSDDKDNTTMFEVGPAWQVKFFTSYPEAKPGTDPVEYELKEHTLPNTMIKVVKGESLDKKAALDDKTKAYYENPNATLDPTYTGSATWTDKLKTKYAFKHYYDAADTTKAAFEPDTVVAGNMTLKAEYGEPVAWVTTVDNPIEADRTYYADLESAFKAWRRNKIDEKTGEDIFYTSDPGNVLLKDRVLTYTAENGELFSFTSTGNSDYVSNLASIKPAAIKALVEKVSKNAQVGSSSAATPLELGFKFTPSTTMGDTWKVEPVVKNVPAGASDPVAYSDVITQDMFEEKGYLVVKDIPLQPNSYIPATSTAVTVAVCTDEAGNDILQTLTQQTTAASKLSVDGVTKLGTSVTWFKAYSNVEARVTLKNGEELYKATLTEALNTAAQNEDCTVTLLVDPVFGDEAGKNQNLRATGKFTLDFNGHDVDTKGNYTFTVGAAYDSSKATQPETSVTFKDSSAEANGGIAQGVTMVGTTTLTVEGGTISNKDSYGVKVGKYSHLIVKGGSISPSGDDSVAILLNTDSLDEAGRTDDITATVDILGGYVGCRKIGKNTNIYSKVAIKDAAMTTGATPVCNSTVNITGGFVMGEDYALDLNKWAKPSITAGANVYGGTAVFHMATTTAGTHNYMNIVSGGNFGTGASGTNVALTNCVANSKIVNNEDEDTKDPFTKTVLSNVVAMYEDKDGNSVYVSAIDESVLAKSVKSTIGLKLLADTAVVAPLVVRDKGVVIDLNGYTLSAPQITAEQLGKLTDAEKAAKGLTDVASCKYGISVATDGELILRDSTYNSGDADPAEGTIAGDSKLEATIYVAAGAQLIVTNGANVTKAGSGNAIYDAGYVSISSGASRVESESGVAIEVKDGNLDVASELATITGTNAVKFGKSASTNPGKVTIAGGTLTGTTGAALIVDNTGKTLVKTTTRADASTNDIGYVSGGIFKAPEGIAPIQSLDDTGVPAAKDTASSRAYVGQFVCAEKNVGTGDVTKTPYFSAPIDNTALVYNFPDSGYMCSTEADKTTKLYALVKAHTILLDAGTGTFTDGTTLMVYVPDGQLLATGENYEEPTKSQQKFLGWDGRRGLVDTTSTDAKVTETWLAENTIGNSHKLYARYTTNTLTVTLKMNGGAFTPSGDYTSELYTNYGINRRVYDTANKTLKIEKVPEGTAVSTLVLTAAKGSYAAELAGTTTGMVFDSWKNAAGTVVTTITEDIELTAAWKPVPLNLNDGVNTAVWKYTEYEYGKALKADEVKAALTKMVEDNKAELLAKAPADKKLVEDDMFVETVKAETMTDAVTYTIKWTDKVYVAQVGNDKFETIDEAIAAAGTDKVITLLKEIESVELAKGQSIKVTPVDNLPKANVKVPEDQALKTDTKDTYTEYAAADIVAQIGNEKYASLEDAIANNASNAPIDLKKAASYKLPAGTSLKIKEGAELATITDSKNQPVTGVKGADGVTTFTDTNEKEKHTVTFVVETAQSQVEVEDGQPVAKPADPTSETYKDFVEWQTAEGEAYDFSKPVTANMTLTAVLTPSSFKRRVDFEGQLKLVFTFAPTEAATKAGAKVVWTDKDGKVTTVALDELNEGKLEIPTMLPEWAEQVNVKLVVGSKPVALIDGDGFDCTNGFNYSIQQYTLDAQEKSTNPKMIALGKALYDYGTAAQIHFKVGDYSGLTVSDEVKAVTKDQIGESVTRSGELPEGITATGASVNFESDHSLRVSYTLASGKKPSDYTVKVTDKTGAEKTVEWEDKGNGVYHIKVKNIAGAELADEYTFAISAGGKTHTTVMSGVRYAATAVEKGSATMKDLGKACYLYYKAAAAYFGK